LVCAVTNSPALAELARFVSALRFEQLPAEVVDAVRIRLLDILAASSAGVIAGNQERLLRLLPDAGPIGIWGTAARRSLRDAIIINTAVSHSAYFEDGSRYTGGHPASAVIPAVLAQAQVTGANGGTVAAAIVAGYEVFLRLGRAIYPATVRRGFQSTAILAAPAAAAACAVLRGLGPDETMSAIAIACSHGAGLKGALKSADSQPLQVGRSSEGGFLSALFAAQGATGSPTILEDSFFCAFAGEVHQQRLTESIGKHWHIGETYLKIHGGCRGNHAPVDAVAALVNAHGLRPEQIDHIAVRVDNVTRAAAIEQPRDGDQAQFSIGFSIAALLVTGDAMPARYTDALLIEPDVNRLMSRITVEADAALDVGYPDRRPTEVEIVLQDGRRLRSALDVARGEPENPLSVAEVEYKFMQLAPQLFGSRAAQIRDRALAFDSLPAANALTDLLAVSDVPQEI
jgi:2-methylcitrate dehydratase PrpD